MVKSLLSDPRIDPSDRDNASIAFACFYQQTEIVRILLSDSRVDPTIGGNFLLFCACQLNNENLIKALISDSRVDPSVVFNFPLYSSSKEGNLEIVKLLCSDERVDPTAHQNRAFNIAVEMYSFFFFTFSSFSCHISSFNSLHLGSLKNSKCKSLFQQ